MDEQSHARDKERELKQPDEPVKDLEPDEEEGEQVKGGTYIKWDYNT